MGECLGGVFGSGLVVFVREDVRVRKEKVRPARLAVDELRESGAGAGAGTGAEADAGARAGVKGRGGKACNGGGAGGAIIPKGESVRGLAAVFN
jgi:hypothetical protein